MRLQPSAYGYIEMSDTNPSANMSLPIPVVGQDAGPDYALNVNSCLTIVDGHTHTTGSGVPITPSALNINADLTFQDNNATNFRSVRMSSQGTALVGASDLDCIYVVGVDLYYNDGVGNNVRITQSGGVAGSPGSISNLTSPASASYVSGNQTFVWQSDSNTAANLDAGSVIFRNITASSNGITVSAPNALAANYNLVWPTALPGTTFFMGLDASGNISAYASSVGGIVGSNIAAATIATANLVDQSVTTAKIADANVTAVKLATDSVETAKINALAVTAAKIATGTITSTQIASGGVATLNIQSGAVTPSRLSTPNFGFTSSCGLFATSSTSFVPITNLATLLLSQGGRPVYVALVSDGVSSANGGYINTTGSGTQALILLLRDSTVIATYQVSGTDLIPGSCISTYDQGATVGGLYTYSAQARVTTGAGGTVQVFNMKLICYEH